MFKAMCVGYVLFFIGLAVGEVGTIPDNPTDPYPASLPFTVAFAFAAPAFLGYMAGREDGN